MNDTINIVATTLLAGVVWSASAGAESPGGMVAVPLPPKAALIAATVTFPLKDFRGMLGTSLIYASVAAADVSAEGVVMNAPFLPQGATYYGQGASRIYLSSAQPVPNGHYVVRIDFVNVAAAANLAFNSGATVINCALVAKPGYQNVQSCQISMTVTNGTFQAILTPVGPGPQLNPVQVTVTRYVN